MTTMMMTTRRHRKSATPSRKTVTAKTPTWKRRPQAREVTERQAVQVKVLKTVKSAKSEIAVKMRVLKAVGLARTTKARRLSLGAAEVAGAVRLEGHAPPPAEVAVAVHRQQGSAPPLPEAADAVHRQQGSAPALLEVAVAVEAAVLSQRQQQVSKRAGRHFEKNLEADTLELQQHQRRR
jgi:hypothetical protein